MLLSEPTCRSVVARFVAHILWHSPWWAADPKHGWSARDAQIWAARVPGRVRSQIERGWSIDLCQELFSLYRSVSAAILPQSMLRALLSNAAHNENALLCKSCSSHVFKSCAEDAPGICWALVSCARALIQERVHQQALSAYLQAETQNPLNTSSQAFSWRERIPLGIPAQIYQSTYWSAHTPCLCYIRYRLP